MILDYEPKRKAAPFLLDWRQSGDQVTLRLETMREYPNPVQPEDWPLASTGPTRRYGDFLTWTTSLNDLQNDDLTSAPATLFYSAQTNWQPWMFMGQGPGHLLWHASGAKYNALDELPVSFVESVDGLHPDLLRDTDNYLDNTGVLLNELARRRDAL